MSEAVAVWLTLLAIVALAILDMAGMRDDE